MTVEEFTSVNYLDVLHGVLKDTFCTLLPFPFHIVECLYCFIFRAKYWRITKSLCVSSNSHFYFFF